ncbi:MAG: hypothetical protein U0228_30085 [Myxococcaceae bacterium]
MRSAGRSLLKFLALSVAVLFLLGAMLTAVTDLFGDSKMRTLFTLSADALAAEPAKTDAGARPPTMFHATKAAPMPLPRREDAGAPLFFPASKSAGGEPLPGVEQKLNPPPQAVPQQAPNAPNPAPSPRQAP